MDGGDGVPEARQPAEIVRLDPAAMREPGGAAAAADALGRSFPPPPAFVLASDLGGINCNSTDVSDEDMVSCVSDVDDFCSCMGEEIAEDIRLDAQIGVDTAECGPAQGEGPGVCSPKVLASPDARAAGAGGPPPPAATPDASGGDGAYRPVAAVVGEISTRFGLTAAHATLLSTAAVGCPSESDRTPCSRIRGVFPLPFLCRHRRRAEGPMRAGERRRAVHRDRVVSKTNLVVGLLNLLFGGRDCMTTALETRAGAAQLSALSRVQGAVKSWNFTADVAEAEALAGQPIAGYAMGEELRSAVDTVPDLVKLPSKVGSARLLDLLPAPLAAVYADEANVVRGGIHTEAAAVLRTKAFMSPPLREEARYLELVKRMWDADMLVMSPHVRERVGLFTVPRPDDLQRLVVDPRPTNEQWTDPPPVHLTSGPLLARQLQRGRRGATSSAAGPWLSKSDLSDFYYNLRIPAWMSAWFALPRVPGWLVGLPEREWVDVGFGVLPMGASHAVALAQEAHCEILRRAGLPEGRRLVDGSPLLDAGPFFLVQIDDLVLGATDEEDRAVVEAWLQAALVAYEAAGLQNLNTEIKTN